MNMLADDLQNSLGIFFTSQLDVKAPRTEPKKDLQKTGIADICTMRGVPVAARTGVDTDTSAVFVRKVVNDSVVQLDEIFQHSSGGIQFQREASFCEIDLHTVGAMDEALPDPRRLRSPSPRGKRPTSNPEFP